MIEHIQPPGLLDARAFGFTHAVKTDRHNHVFIAGQTALDAHGHTVGGDDLARQTVAALDNLGLALQAAGASPADLVAIRVYVVGLQLAMFGTIAPHIEKFLEPAEPPASTWLGVQSLLSPSTLIEIEAVAAIV